MMESQAVRWGHLIVWEFHVRLEQQAEFEKAYGAQGDWARLFQQGEGHIATELNRDLNNPGRYVTLDFWESREAYDRFREQHKVEYKAMDEKCQAMTEKEVELGTFERIGARLVAS